MVKNDSLFEINQHLIEFIDWRCQHYRNNSVNRDENTKMNPICSTGLRNWAKIVDDVCKNDNNRCKSILKRKKIQ